MHKLSLILLSLLTANALALDNDASRLDSLRVDGVQREWRLFVPSSYRENTAAALVLEFHGSGATPESQMELSGLVALAEKHGFLLVAPAAKYARASDGRLTWTVDGRTDGVDDVAFVAALIDRLSAQYAIDKQRIFATGFSGGARMSSRLACNLSERIAAIAAVGGVRFPEDCAPARPVPVVAFHGKQDRINTYDLRDNSPDYWRMGVEDAVQGWAKNNGCTEQANEQALSAEETRLAWPGCRGGADVVFYRSETADHTWPGTPIAERFLGWLGPDAVSSTPATSLIWEFFKAHPLPADAD